MKNRALLGAVLLSVAYANIGSAEVRVAATLSTFADLIETIGGDHVSVSYVAAPKFNPHFIEPRPSDVLKVKRADVFAHAGLDLELWSGPLRDAAGNRDVMPGAAGNLDLSVGVQLLEVPTGRQTRAAGDIHLYGNPHYWLDPRNAKIMAENIARKLTEIDPDHAADFEANLNAFIADLNERIAAWQARMAPYRGTELLGYHNQWPYLMRFLGLEMEHFLEPKPGVPPGPKHIDSLMDYASSTDIRGIVRAVYFPGRAPEALSKSTGVPTITLSQNVGDIAEATNYIAMIEYNVQELARVCGESASND